MSGKFLRGARIAVAAAWLGAGSALAQQQGPAPLATDPLFVYPGIDLGLGYDDNLYSSNINKRDSAFTLFSPWLRAEAKPGPHRFDFIAAYTAGRYSESSADDYDDFRIGVGGQAVLNERTDIGLRADYVYGHDARGSTDRPSGDEPDTYVNAGIEGTFGYGARGARGRLEAVGSFYRRDYQNNHEFTAASDYDTGRLGGTFFWRVAPKSQVLVQLDRRHFDYALETSTQDSHETRIYVGTRWDATALTSGTVKVGWLKKEFDSDSRQDFTTSSWEVGVRWSPLTYSVFDFGTSRQTNESTGVGDATVTSRYALTWTHSWSSRVRSELLAAWTTDDFRGEGVTREDDTGSIGMKLNYQFRRWLRFGAEYSYTERDSSTLAAIYRRNYVLFTVGATL